MFTRWSVSNFKAVRDPVSLDLAPLTIFSGINSSGKSTLIQSILMVSQSFASAVNDEALVLNGRFLQLGRLQDVLHYRNDDEPLEIALEWVPARAVREDDSIAVSLAATIRKGNREATNGKRADRHYPMLTYSKLEYGGIDDWLSGQSNRHELRIEQVGRPDISSEQAARPDLRRQIEEDTFNYAIIHPEAELLVSDARLERAERVALTNLIPERLLVAVDGEVRRLREDYDWIITKISRGPHATRNLIKENPKAELSERLFDIFDLVEFDPRAPEGRMKPVHDFKFQLTHARQRGLTRWNFLTLLDGSMLDRWQRIAMIDALSAAYVRFQGRPKPKRTFVPTRDVSYEERLLPAELMQPINLLCAVMREQVYFLGPLRDKPRVIYDAPPSSDLWSVGHQGEYTAARLDEFRDRRITYPLPPGDDFDGTYRTRTGRLVDALSVWLRQMGLVDEINTEEAPKIGYRLTVNSPGLKMPLDLTSVGVGVSQVLPTLVQALLAPVDSVIIFEQPELHLHPKVESVLGDFFLAMAQLGKQCLVETHSEHLITRLRRRITEARGDELLSQLRIYFVEKEGTAAKFREVRPNRFGAILDWPEGFFDQAEQEAQRIIESQINKRREVRASLPDRKLSPKGGKQ